MHGARELIVTAALGLAAIGCGEAEPGAGRLQIPSIGVDTRLETLGLRPDGRLAPPKDPDRAGWWRGGARPGERGTAVIAGHVDTRTGPAVFARLPMLRRGDRILIDGTRYVATATEEHPKAAFPTQRVYGASRRAALRLITCSGIFDRASGHYRSNFVVFAEIEPTEGAGHA